MFRAFGNQLENTSNPTENDEHRISNQVWWKII